MTKTTDQIDDWQITFEKLAEEVNTPILRSFYQAGVAGLRIPLRDAPMVALDIETTGLDPNGDDIISIGLVEFSLDRIPLNAAQYWLAKPHGPLTAESVTIHEITHDEIKDAPRLSSFLDEVLTAIAGKIVVVHCAAIERPFLNQAAEKLYGEPLIFPIIDTMALEAEIIHKPWWKRFGRQPSIRLDSCRQRYHLPRYRAHQALIDAISCAELFQAQAAHHYDHDKLTQDFCC
ncbi:3'-5' exonuclease [Marinomonas piezotolerans]|uniref:DNA-directed DNA polymerase n=1 Tax=Marinomonas piezotolerans TaxID=2213058 RepID=A0A370UAL5_9GAMM|nr:3'-5' exonuclease [Marinomonas piezotolerans]RDL44819.1 3'-5' exonuclease [Marinomonas piezotolerans]